MPGNVVRFVTVFVLWSCLGFDGLAGDAKPAKQEPEQLAPPRQFSPPITYYIVPAAPPRLDTRAAWSLYGVDQMGRFRPRVVLSPYGSYYLRNGEPYPWMPEPRLVMPRTSD
jgi:hypothetical protein